MIPQKHKYGCGISCIAEILLTSYNKIHAEFPTIDFNKSGLVIDAICNYLGDRNYAYIKKSLYRAVPNTPPREVWPPEPFAPIHIAQVQIGKNSHFVIMREGGEIECPSDKIKSFEQCDRVVCLVGFFNIAK